MSRRSEKTQKGNPHALTVRQHVFPRASIDRFVKANGVELYDFKRNLQRRAKPDDHMFCADRAWAHGPESGWMKDIENAFQKLVGQMLPEMPSALNGRQSETITEFYALWQARAERRHLPHQEIPKATGVLGTRVTYTEDDLEVLEKNNIAAFRGDGSISMRHIMGPRIRLHMDAISQALRGRQWGIVTSANGEFCVPDVPAHGIIPITPTVLLDSSRSGAISRDEVVLINWLLASKSREYLFARSLKACPGLA